MNVFNAERKSVLVLILGVLSLYFVSSAHSQVEARLNVAKPTIKRIVYDTKTDSASWLLPLGPIERIDGLWQPEKRLTLEGRVRRRTIEFSAEQSEQKIFSAYRQALINGGAQTLFSCSGRDCGRSNNWANRFFSVYQLYGKEDSQRLGSYRWSEQGQEHYAVLYLVRRGNKRIYLQQESLSRNISAQVQAVLPSAEQLWQSWQDTGVLRLTQAGGQLDDSGSVKAPWLGLIASVLKAKSKQNIECVSHDFSGARSMDNAAERLRVLLAAFKELGIDERRLKSHNLANLAPLDARPEGPRIDLLLR